MTRFLLVACGYWLSSLAHACTCEPTLLDSAGARQARDVFIFQLVSARVLPGRADDFTGPDVEGEIAIIDRLRGRATFRTMRFSTGRCCGSRFDVGAYFVGFLSGPGPFFDAHAGNVVEIGERQDVQGAHADVAAVLAGQRELADVFPRWMTERVMQNVVPPPCPRTKTKEKK